MGLNKYKAAIVVAENLGMPEEFIDSCKDALKEALIIQRSSLYEVADDVVKRLIDTTNEPRWLCHIYPAKVDAGLSYFRKGSICLTFGPPDMLYECRIACLY